MPYPITPATIVAAVLFGAIAAYLADRRGRNPYKWFFVGFFFGVFGIFSVFFAPPLKKKRTRARAKPAREVKPEPPPEPVLSISGPSDKFWYYLDLTHQTQGPMSHNALTSALREGKISLATYVWNEEMPDWKSLQDFVKG